MTSQGIFDLSRGKRKNAEALAPGLGPFESEGSGGHGNGTMFGRTSNGTGHSSNIGKDKKDESTRVQDIRWFAELSLFMAFAHTWTLKAKTVGHVYEITDVDFADALKVAPAAIIAAYEYGKNLLNRVNKDHEILMGNMDDLPLSFSVEAC